MLAVSIIPRGNRKEEWNVNEHTDITFANEETSSLIDKWRHQLIQTSMEINDLECKPENVGHDMNSTVVPVSELWMSQLHSDLITKSECMCYNPFSFLYLLI